LNIAKTFNLLCTSFFCLVLWVLFNVHVVVDISHLMIEPFSLMTSIFFGIH
jgi:hypothetical protein